MKYLQDISESESSSGGRSALNGGLMFLVPMSKLLRAWFLGMEGMRMDEKNLAVLKSEIFSRVRSILSERYGEFVPASLVENELQSESVVTEIRRFESFRADEDLLDLFDALQRLFTGNYGYCLLCRNEIEFPKLRRNPLSKFCDGCERMLAPSFHSRLKEDGAQ
ncbi:MAG: hypothetical protein M1469_09065 [Bacteroidetes bacterium]|nr:hypothetical protein [Bacteroidota bacterium]MCL5268237.1 hypothetical protein [Bacteroidota bacterium]